MIKKDKPDLVLISGDLTKDGEKLGHQNMAEKLQTIEDETDAEIFVINGNHDIYNYQDLVRLKMERKKKQRLQLRQNLKRFTVNLVITESTMRSIIRRRLEKRQESFLFRNIWGLRDYWN